MKKIFLCAIATFAGLSFSQKASATIVEGDFCADRTALGWYIDCQDSKNYCGYVGSESGRYYFMACDGTGWWLTKATYDPSEDLQEGMKLYAEPAEPWNLDFPEGE